MHISVRRFAVWKNSRTNSCYDIAAVAVSQGTGPLRVRACTWNVAGRHEELLEDDSAAIFEEWLGASAMEEVQEDVVSVCFQGVEECMLPLLRQRLKEVVGERFHLVASKDSIGDDLPNLAMYVFVSASRLCTDDAAVLSLTFVNAHLPTQCGKGRHHMSQIFDSIARGKPTPITFDANVRAVKGTPVVELVMGDLSMDCLEQKPAESLRTSCHAEEAHFEFGSNIRFFGFNEGYLADDLAGRDRVIYRASDHVVVKVQSYQICSRGRGDRDITRHRGPVFKTFNIVTGTKESCL